MNVIGYSGLTHSVPFKKREFPNLESRHYRITQGFDAAAALVNNQGIQAAAAEERFTREKTTGTFPYYAIQYCLEAAGLKIDDVDYVAHSFNYQPYRDYYNETELGRKLYEEVFSKEVQLALLQEHFPSRDWSDKFIQLPHHLTHAASTFYVSGFEEALIVVADGMGEQHSLTVALGQGDDIRILKQIPSIHSLGILYSVFTLYLGFLFNMDEYKTFLVSYRHDGAHWTLKLKAKSIDDAQTRLGKLLYATVDGELIATIPASLGPLAIMATVIRNGFARVLGASA